MYYKIKEDGIFKIDLDTFWDSGECVGVFKMTEWDNEKILWEKCFCNIYIERQGNNIK